jgi:parallel beta-helix repeat protein
MELLRKTVSGIMLALLIISMLMLVDIQPVRGSGTIYIRADGYVAPLTAPIRRDGNVYTFTGNIFDSIVVQKPYITIDGSGYTLEGSGSGPGIDLNGIHHVEVKRINIKSFWAGISFGSYPVVSSDNVISDNYITNNAYGIYLPWRSSKNIISGNLLISNTYCVYLDASSYNKITNNNIMNIGNKGEGIELGTSSNNLISGNNIIGTAYGILLAHQSNTNNVSSNNITNNDYGIHLVSSSDSNSISGNNVTNNRYGIYIDYSFYNIVSNNTITSNSYGIYIVDCAMQPPMPSKNNRIYHNRFIDNIEQVYSSNSITYWDNGYPSGGNYWSDYKSVDERRGPEQDQPGSDGIWDHPYVIGAQDMDRYPVVPEFTSAIVLPLFILTTLIVIILLKKKRKTKP